LIKNVVEKVAEAETGIKPQDTEKVDQLDSDYNNSNAEADDNKSLLTEGDTNLDNSTAEDSNFSSTENKSSAISADNSQNYDDTDNENESSLDESELGERVVFVDSILNNQTKSKTQANNNNRLDEKIIYYE
jgi:hypothetical protein